MKTKNTNISIQNNIIRIIIATVLILMIPLVAMMFTNEVDWNLFDFIVMGTLLLGTGFMYELITRMLGYKYQAAIAIVLVGALLFIWAELAVGIFGSPFAGS